MIALTAILGLSLLPLAHAADQLAVREEAKTASVTVTVDWLYPVDPTDYAPPEPEPSSSSTWSGWGPSYYQPPSPSSTSSSTGGGCRPHTSHTSQWPNSSSTPITTLVTTRPVTITTFTTEPWSTVMGDATPSSSTDTGAPDYPVPTWTRCPYAEDVFNCGGGGNDKPVALAVEMRAEDDKEEAESSVAGETTPGQSADPFSAARGKSDAVLGSLWLVLGLMALMV